MLKKVYKDIFDQYIEYAWSLAVQPEKTSYPAYFDGIKTKEDFICRGKKGLSRPEEEILLYMEAGDVLGWIHYYYLKEDNYLSTVSLSIETHTEKALAEFIIYVSEKYPGYNIWLGFPEENQEAIFWLGNHGFECGEESYNNVLSLSDYQSKKTATDIVRITENNFDLFENIHSQFDEEMYWDCQHIRDCLDEWLIFLSVQEDEVKGAVYCLRGELAEIFGVDFPNNDYSSDVFCDLAGAVLDECKREKSKYMVLFGEEENQKDIISLGFSCVGKYVMMVKKQG